MAKARIMIIDDEPDFLELTKMNLEGTGQFEVMALSGAKELSASLRSFKPELILLDLLMPGIGGVEVCEILNKDPVGQGVPVIVVSALNNTVDRQSVFRQGIVDYIVKPVEKDELVIRIQKALQNKYGTVD
ncbi:MAG: response regulator [Candidatus Omnitrophota bacterium]|jgi:CheY-like chemotaxis protein